MLKMRATERVEHRQEILDRYYSQRGPCCAGCDWWHHINAVAGECRRSAPVSGEQRFAASGLRFISTTPEPGHVITPRGHLCGEFRDEFNWASLPPSYLHRIGRRLDGRECSEFPNPES